MPERRELSAYRLPPPIWPLSRAYGERAVRERQGAPETRERHIADAPWDAPIPAFSVSRRSMIALATGRTSMNGASRPGHQN